MRFCVCVEANALGGIESYDVAIVGAGPDGLVAAYALAQAKLKIIVLEKNATPGGRAATREFHPGFRASPFSDELAEIPPALFWALDPARRGAILTPPPASVSLTDKGAHILFSDDARLARTIQAGAASQLAAFRRDITSIRDRIAARAGSEPLRRRLFFSQHRAAWPGEDWGYETLNGVLAARFSDLQLRLHLAADALSGRAASPFLAGTALHLLAPGTGRSGIPGGGLGSLGAALAHAAQNAGAILRCDANVVDIKVSSSTFGRRRSNGLTLADGTEISAKAILSTLDVSRTFLGLIAWSALPAELVKRVGRFRIQGQRARVLFALDAPPQFSFAKDAPELARATIHVAGSMEGLSRGYDAWRAGTIDESPLVTLRVPSFADPRLAPPGKAVMTATIGAIPARLFDGEWTADKRDRLSALALAAAKRACPGLSAQVLAREVMVAPDFETELGATFGDLDGGELSPDQTLSHRPFAGWDDGRTPITGLYLSGGSASCAPFFTGVSGLRAARHLLADLKRGGAA